MHDPNSTPIKIAQCNFMIHGADSMIEFADIFTACSLTKPDVYVCLSQCTRT